MPKRPLDLRRRALAALDADTLYVGLYARVSTEGQAAPDKTSLDQQLAACRARAEFMATRDGKRLVIVHEWREEGVSGTIPADERPQLSQALEWAKAGRMNVLLSFADDRYARLMVQGMHLVDALEKVGVRYAVCDADYLYDAEGKMLPESRLMQVMRSYLAEADRAKILEKTEGGRRGLAENGKAPVRTWNPYGYKIWQKRHVIREECTPGQAGDYVIVPEQADVLRQVYQHIIAGQSLRMIARYLQDELCLPSPGGSATWRANTLQRIVTDPLYKGTGRYGVRTYRKDADRVKDGLKERYTIPADPSQVVSFDAPAIVSPEVWQAAQEQMARNKTALSGRTAERYLLSGFLRCPDCAGSMNGKHCTGREPTGEPFARFYACARRLSDGNRAKSDLTPRCAFPYVRCRDIESLVSATLAETIARQGCLSKAIMRFQTELKAASGTGDSLTARRDSLERERGNAERAHKAAQAAIDKSLMLDLDADIDRWIDAAKVQRERRDALTRQLAELSAASTDPVIDALLSMNANALAAYVCSMLARIPEVLASPVLSPTEKRFALDAAVASIAPVNETPERKKHRRFGVEVELRRDLLASAIEAAGVPVAAPVEGSTGAVRAVRSLSFQLPEPNRTFDALTFAPATLPRLLLRATANKEVSCFVTF